MRSISDEERAVVDAARGWIGTPYRHQARLKAVGVDCVGLVIGAGLDAGVLDWTEEAFAEWAGYGRYPNPEKMKAGLDRFLVKVPDKRWRRPGDVAWFGWREGRGMHLGILAVDEVIVNGRLTIIHATNDLKKVVEHGFDGQWPGRVEGWWRYPGLASPSGETEG